MMRSSAWAILLSIVLVCSVASAQEPEMRGERPRGNEMEQIEIRNRELDLEERQSEMEFEQRMRDLGLEEREIELERQRQSLRQPSHPRPPHQKVMPGVLAVCIAINILLAIWVFQDTRKRNAGSGIWIAVTLVSGFFGALLYALVRIGDNQK